MNKLIRNCIFAFKCEQKWEEMQITKKQNVKFCLSCQKEVFFCSTDKQLKDAIVLNRCISIEYVEQINNQTIRLMGMPRRNQSDIDNTKF